MMLVLFNNVVPKRARELKVGLSQGCIS